MKNNVRLEPLVADDLYLFIQYLLMNRNGF